MRSPRAGPRPVRKDSSASARVETVVSGTGEGGDSENAGPVQEASARKIDARVERAGACRNRRGTTGRAIIDGTRGRWAKARYSESIAWGSVKKQEPITASHGPKHKAFSAMGRLHLSWIEFVGEVSANSREVEPLPNGNRTPPTGINATRGQRRPTIAPFPECCFPTKRV